MPVHRRQAHRVLAYGLTFVGIQVAVIGCGLARPIKALVTDAVADSRRLGILEPLNTFE